VQERIIAVDWSGAIEHPQRTIWLAEFVNGFPEDLTNGLTRQDVVEYLKKKRRTSSTLVVGLDFAFSCPAWFLRQQQCASATDFWSLVKLQGEEWLRLCPHPFWGKCGRKRPVSGTLLFRKTEEQARVLGFAPKSVFQLAGPGHVGTGSVRGMPFLIDLLEAGFSIWPFHDATAHTVIEIYPRVLTKRVFKRNARDRADFLAEARFTSLPKEWRLKAEQSEDAFDAAVSAYALSSHSRGLMSLKRTMDSDILLEGAIWDPTRSN